MGQARIMAESEGMDLIEISPNAVPPVVKMMDYGKFKYQIQKKAAEAKKKQVVIDVKEIKFRPNIERHDMDVKLNHIEKFLEQGDKVKLLMLVIRHLKQIHSNKVSRCCYTKPLRL